MKEEAVREALAANDAFEILETNYQKDWVSIVCKKK
jgi:ribosomal protein L11 methyltransferase